MSEIPDGNTNSTDATKMSDGNAKEIVQQKLAYMSLWNMLIGIYLFIPVIYSFNFHSNTYIAKTLFILPMLFYSGKNFYMAYFVKSRLNGTKGYKHLCVSFVVRGLVFIGLIISAIFCF